MTSKESQDQIQGTIPRSTMRLKTEQNYFALSFFDGLELVPTSWDK